MSSPSGAGERQFMADLEKQFRDREAEGEQVVSDFKIIDASPEDVGDLDGEASTAAEASGLLDPIVQELAQLGPAGWEQFEAVFAFTVTAEVAQLRFFVENQSGLVPVPKSIAALVRRQRMVAAEMPAGPWWRLLLSVTNGGEMTVDYDYGDQPFPDDQLLAPEDYRDDLDTYPRDHVPVWLAGYIAGPEAQGRDPQRAAAQAAADTTVGRSAVATDDVPGLPEMWARWAVLSAVYVGAGSEWGPRVYPGYGWFESDHRSGSTLYLLPGERAVLSGGKWGSELLEPAYNGGQPLPELYAGAPFWVNDSVLNTRNRNGIMTFCYWWSTEGWYRGATDIRDELDGAIPPIGSDDETVDAMVTEAGSGTRDQCLALLSAVSDRTATHADVSAVFTDHADADIDAAVNQLSLAGLLARD